MSGKAVYKVVETDYSMFSAKFNEFNFFLFSRFKTNCCCGGNVQMIPECFRTVKLHVSVHFKEVEMTPYLNRPVACVSHSEFHGTAVHIVFNRSVFQDYPSYRHGFFRSKPGGVGICYIGSAGEDAVRCGVAVLRLRLGSSSGWIILLCHNKSL